MLLSSPLPSNGVEPPATWLVTGAAGFIGSHLASFLLSEGKKVVAVDNFSTGSRRNLERLEGLAANGPGSLRFVEGDLCDQAVCQDVMQGVDLVLHQAALASVPRSMADPIETHHANLTAFVNLLVAARDAGVRRVVYASSSAVYGDDLSLPKTEPVIGRPLSPYAVTKRANELYAESFQSGFDMSLVGLRYFNVFGPRQDPEGPYAAVIPRWIESLLDGERCTVYGDGETSRDFCFVDNVVHANLLAATRALPGASAQVYNVACGARTTLNELFQMISTEVEGLGMDPSPPIHAPDRPGDIRHSAASIDAVQRDLEYKVTHQLQAGLALTVEWHAAQRSPAMSALATSR